MVSLSSEPAERVRSHLHSLPALAFRHFGFELLHDTSPSRLGGFEGSILTKVMTRRSIYRLTHENTACENLLRMDVSDAAHLSLLPLHQRLIDQYINRHNGQPQGWLLDQTDCDAVIPEGVGKALVCAKMQRLTSKARAWGDRIPVGPSDIFSHKQTATYRASTIDLNAREARRDVGVDFFLRWKTSFRAINNRTHWGS
jgi:hypothetical protein